MNEPPMGLEKGERVVCWPMVDWRGAEEGRETEGRLPKERPPPADLASSTSRKPATIKNSAITSAAKDIFLLDSVAIQMSPVSIDEVNSPLYSMIRCRCNRANGIFD
jgi:hypothetical protein